MGKCTIFDYLSLSRLLKSSCSSDGLEILTRSFIHEPLPLFFHRFSLYNLAWISIVFLFRQIAYDMWTVKCTHTHTHFVCVHSEIDGERVIQLTKLKSASMSMVWACVCVFILYCMYVRSTYVLGGFIPLNWYYLYWDYIGPFIWHTQ